MSNPFFYGGRIENPQHFVGRKAELRAIFSALETFEDGQAQHISVVGERRIGKSSLLYHVIQTFPQKLKNPERYRFAFVDLDNPQCHTLPGLLQFILKGLGISAPAQISLAQFSAEITRRHERDKICPVICLDEFEHLVSRGEHFPNQVYETFRSLASANAAVFLTASRTSLPDLIQQNSLTSTFPNIFSILNLGNLTPDEANFLMLRAETCEPPFTPQVLKLLRKLGGAHPYKLQAAGSLIYLYGGPGDPDEKKISDLFQKQIGQAGLAPKKTATPRLWARLLDSLRTSGRAILGIAREKDKISDESALLVGILPFVVLALVLIFGLDAMIDIYRQLTQSKP